MIIAVIHTGECGCMSDARRIDAGFQIPDDGDERPRTMDDTRRCRVRQRLDTDADSDPDAGGQGTNGRRKTRRGMDRIDRIDKMGTERCGMKRLTADPVFAEASSGQAGDRGRMEDDGSFDPFGPFDPSTPLRVNRLRVSEGRCGKMPVAGYQMPDSGTAKRQAVP